VTRRRALRALALVATGVAACAPIQAPPPPAGPGPHYASGTVQTVSPDGRRVTLLDGMRLYLPNPRPFIHDDLRPGAFVLADYVREGGQNVVTRITIHPPQLDRDD
jgi:hypothetical protein